MNNHSTFKRNDTQRKTYNVVQTVTVVAMSKMSYCTNIVTFVERLNIKNMWVHYEISKSRNLVRQNLVSKISFTKYLKIKSLK